FTFHEEMTLRFAQSVSAIKCGILCCTISREVSLYSDPCRAERVKKFTGKYMVFHKTVLFHRTRAHRRGATLVEFALVIPLLLLFCLGIMEFGWMAKNRLQLANATREGARDAAVGLSTDSIQTRIRNRSAGLPGVPSTLAIHLQRDDGDDAS